LNIIISSPTKFNLFKMIFLFSFIRGRKSLGRLSGGLFPQYLLVIFSLISCPFILISLSLFIFLSFFIIITKKILYLTPNFCFSSLIDFFKKFIIIIKMKIFKKEEWIEYKSFLWARKKKYIINIKDI
jgi:hypothetical protein